MLHYLSAVTAWLVLFFTFWARCSSGHRTDDTKIALGGSMCNSVHFFSLYEHSCHWFMNVCVNVDMYCKALSVVNRLQSTT